MDESTFNATVKQDEPAIHVAKQQRAMSPVYCHLHCFRDTPLQLELHLDARDHSAADWNTVFTHRVTALYGLQTMPVSDHSGLTTEIQDLLHDQFIPAIVVDSEGKVAGQLLALMREARFFPQTMEVVFEDDRTCNYLVVLGSMAFQVCAELLVRFPAAMKYAPLQRRIEDDSPFIC